jgi:hypothetical protein
VRVTVPVVPDATVALNAALDAPAGTTTQLGVLTPGLLLVTLMPNPPAGDSPVILTLQEAVPESATKDEPHVMELNSVSTAASVTVTPHAHNKSSAGASMDKRRAVLPRSRR